MTTTKQLLGLVFTALLFSCSDDVTFNNDSVPTAQEFRNIQLEAFENLKQTTTFNAETGVVFTSARGVTLNIPANCLTLNGNAVLGSVTLEYVEIFERGDMLTTSATTVGIDGDNNLELLRSGGEFHIEAFQNGQKLSLSSSCGMMIHVPTSITGDTDNDMAPFAGALDQNNNLIWTPMNTEFWISNDQQGAMGESYNAFLQDFGWFNCDRFYNFTGPKTAIQVSVPGGYNQQNSNIFIAISGEPNALGFLYGEFPVGLDVHIIFLTEENGDYKYAIKSMTLGINQQVSFVLNDLSVATIAQVTQIINDLP